jgi:hypothetical protein
VLRGSIESALTARVAVVNYSALDRPAGLVAPPQRHPQACLHEAGVFHSRCLPADDRPGEEVDSEGDIDEPGPGGDIGEVGDPTVIGSRGRELAVQQVSGTRAVLGGDRRHCFAPAHEPGHAFYAHHPVDSVL